MTSGQNTGCFLLAAVPPKKCWRLEKQVKAQIRTSHLICETPLLSLFFIKILISSTLLTAEPVQCISGIYLSCSLTWRKPSFRNMSTTVSIGVWNQKVDLHLLYTPINYQGSSMVDLIHSTEQVWWLMVCYSLGWVYKLQNPLLLLPFQSFL